MSAVPEVWVTMAKIFATMFATLGALGATLTPARAGTRVSARGGAQSGWLCDPSSNPSKYHAEVFILKVSACWIASVGVVIFLGTYEWWGRWGYMAYCVMCAVPYVLVPLFAPRVTGDVVKSKGARGKGGGASLAPKPLGERYIFKANLWIAVFSFIGNYWYTHYFYGVLNAKYTFDAHRLNDVPIALYFMTHAYFMFYHVLSNCALRKTRATFNKDTARFFFECALIAVMAYTTAFMESLTICGFPYYSFEDKDMAYTLGSAFYGIYFLVSFPMFLAVDENAKSKKTYAATFWEALGSGMAVLCLLDFVRLRLGLDFVMRAAK